MSLQHSPPAVTFHIAWQRHAVTLSVSGDIDFITAGLLSERIADVLQGHPDQLIIDLAGVRYIDVAGARAIARATRAVAGRRPLILRSARPIVCRIFQLTCLDQLCVIEPWPPAGITGKSILSPDRHPATARMRRASRPGGGPVEKVTATVQRPEDRGSQLVR